MYDEMENHHHILILFKFYITFLLKIECRRVCMLENFGVLAPRPDHSYPPVLLPEDFMPIALKAFFWDDEKNTSTVKLTTRIRGNCASLCKNTTIQQDIQICLRQ